MKKYVKAFIIGMIAAVIDVVPMLLQNLEASACISAFAQWLMLGMVIPFVNWQIKAWLKGMIIAVMMGVPVMILVAFEEPESVLPIFAFSMVLGSFVGWAGKKYVTQ